MTRTRKLVIGAAAVLVVGGGGVAIGATQLDSPSQRSQAIINDAAGQLGIQPSQLSDALKKAIENQIDAAVSAGTLSQQQGDALKKRIESGDVPLVGGFGFGGGPRAGFGFPGPRGFGFGLIRAGLDTAASYLGVTAQQLRTDLMNGKSLADVANDQSKSVDGLVQALVNAAKQKLQAAVTAGKLSPATESQIESKLTQAITDLVNGKRPAAVMPFSGTPGGGFGFRHFRGGFGGGFGGAPPRPPGPTT